MNRNCGACNTKTDINNYKEDRTVCESCYKKNKRKNNDNTLIQNKTTVSHQQAKIENGSISDNNRTLLAGPSFCGKTCLMIKILSRIPDRDVFKITKSPPEQYSTSKIKIKEIGDEIQPVNEYENAILVFNDFFRLIKQQIYRSIFH